MYQAWHRYLYLILHVSIIISENVNIYIGWILKKQRISADHLYEKLEDSKMVIKSSISKNRQYRDHTKTDHNHLQNTILKNKGWVTWIAQKIEGELRCFRSVNMSCTISGAHCVYISMLYKIIIFCVEILCEMFDVQYLHYEWCYGWSTRWEVFVKASTSTSLPVVFMFDVIKFYVIVIYHLRALYI